MSKTNINFSGFLPTICATASSANCLPSGQVGNYEQEYVDDLGIVSLPQVLLTRAGSNLAIQPAGTPAFDQVTIMTYDMYFSDSWHIKPSITLTYGLNYGIQMPPSRSERQAGFAGRFERKPNQRLILPEQSVQCGHQRQLLRPTYTPELGYELVGNVGAGREISIQSVLRRFRTTRCTWRGARRLVAD